MSRNQTVEFVKYATRIFVCKIKARSQKVASVFCSTIHRLHVSFHFGGPVVGYRKKTKASLAFWAVPKFEVIF